MITFSEPTTATCSTCSREYEHASILVDGRDICGGETICDPCLEEAKVKAEEAAHRAQVIRQFRATVPAEYVATDLSHPDYPRATVHAQAFEWLNSTDSDRRPWIGLIGKSGTCKTRVISQLVKLYLWEKRSVCWMNSARFQWAAQHQFSDERDAARTLARARQCDVLVFDDIGSLKGSEAVSDALYDVLESRSSHRRPMLWTSNEQIDQMLVGKATEIARTRNLSRLGGYSRIIPVS